MGTSRFAQGGAIPHTLREASHRFTAILATALSIIITANEAQFSSNQSASNLSAQASQQASFVSPTPPANAASTARADRVQKDWPGAAAQQSYGESAYQAGPIQQTPASPYQSQPSNAPYSGPAPLPPVQPSGYDSQPYQGYSGYSASPYGQSVYPPQNVYGSGHPVPPAPNSGYGFQPPGGVTSGPGGSDQCFRKYPNCIIVNAQPFDRKTLVSVDECKQRCLSYQTGTYVCKAFVYDITNQVCDLFAHTGNVYPARLIQFYGRDYYEPTGLCSGYSSVSTYSPATTRPTVGPTIVPTATGCPSGTEVRYMKVEGYHIAGSRETTLSGLTEQQCIQICTDGRTPTGQQVTCKSFEFDQSTGNCFFGAGLAAPAGVGKLSALSSQNYYEKFCLDSAAAVRCPNVFDRVPQKILVGYAETVVDAKSYQDCLTACVGAQTNFGFNCISGMYYYMEPELNCILNTESRRTQPQLFTDEKTDIVDYFEPNCNRGRQSLASLAESRSALSSNSIIAAGRQQLDQVDSPLPPPFSTANSRSTNNVTAGGLLPVFGEWTSWSDCDRSSQGRRIRYRVCSDYWNLHDCPLESEWCNTGPNAASNTNNNFLQSKRRSEDSSFPAANLVYHANAKAAKVVSQGCLKGDCCPHNGSCRIGRKENDDGKLQWCLDPCHQNNGTDSFNAVTTYGNATINRQKRY